MRYIWGLVLGVVFSLVASIAFLLTWMWAAMRQMHKTGLQGEVGFDVVGIDLVSILRHPIFWIVVAGAFSIGFALAMWKSSTA